MILSFAQQMYLHFEEDGLVQLAKEASEKSVGAINYGNKQDCDELLERLQKRMETEHGDVDVAGVLRRRAELIGDAAQFRHDDDAVPIPATVSTIFAIDANDVIHRSDCRSSRQELLRNRKNPEPLSSRQISRRYICLLYRARSPSETPGIRALISGCSSSLPSARPTGEASSLLASVLSS